MKEVFSPIHLKDTQLVKFLMDVDIASADLPFENEVKFEISGTNTRHEVDDNGLDSCEYVLLVVFERYPDKGKKIRRKKPSFKIEVAARGIVETRFGDAQDEDKKDQVLRANSISLLYGEVRSYVTLMTSASPAGKIILPTIDPWNLAEIQIEMEAEKQAAEK